MSKVSQKLKFKCEHCARVFQTFTGLSDHALICEFAKRANLQDTKEGQLAHKLWCISFKTTPRKKFDYSVFIKHREYKLFFEFAAFCCKVNALDAEKYMDWCIKERIKSKLWISEGVYSRFVKNFLIHEDPVDAVIRSIDFIKKSGTPNYFGTVHPGTFITLVEVGRISPWLYLLYWNSNVILKRMNADQLNYFNTVVDQSIWSMLQRRHKNICEEIKKTLKKEML